MITLRSFRQSPPVIRPFCAPPAKHRMTNIPAFPCAIGKRSSVLPNGPWPIGLLTRQLTRQKNVLGFLGDAALAVDLRCLR